MRILHVITSLETGGAENLISEMVPLLKKKGVEVDVLTFIGGETPFYEKLRKNSINVYSLARKGSVYRVGFIFKIFPFLKKYDIIHTHNTACQLFVALAKMIIPCKCKLVTTEHSTENRRRSKWWLKPFDKWMYSRYEKIISISEIATKLLIDYIGYDSKVITIPNGVNIEKFHSARPNKEYKKEGDVIISMVAGFRVGKDQDTLIKALQYLPTNYKVWLLGDGVRRNEIDNLISKLSLRERVRLFGVRSDVPELLQASDVIVMSSRYEGLSLASIEGMSVNKPFIASDVKGLHQTTIGAGILFPYQNDRKLAEEILKLMEDSLYYQQVARACYKRAQLFDIDTTVNGYLEVYNNLLLQ